MNKTTYNLPTNLGVGIDDIAKVTSLNTIVERIWAKDASVWTDNGEESWLGWLDVVGHELAKAGDYVSLAESICDADIDDIVLMGMGGSSLCPEVLAKSLGNERFHILDSTVPAQVLSLHGRIDPAKTLFIVASKSGSTLEPNCFFAYFFDVVTKSVGRDNAGNHFIAITDPSSKMEQAAAEHGFRKVIFGEPTVGGRFSALSPFGLAAAALIGYDIERFLANASSMVELCRQIDVMKNPGAALGIFLGANHAAGRDKLTIFTSGIAKPLGAWLEQLIAESTGKNGVAIIPVDGEPLSCHLFDAYQDDRMFAFVSAGANAEFADAEQELLKREHPSVSIVIEDEYDLAGEFFRWEFATAVAGSLMGINPFDQPDVESAKIEARKLTDAYETTGSLPAETPFFSEDGIELYAGEDHATRLSANGGSLSEIISSHVSTIDKGDYFALLAYLEMNTPNSKVLGRIREAVLSRNGAATCLGFGPRFLHSTGQAYKGGPNNGVFLQITSDDETDLDVPGREYTFGVVKAAQARGDFEVLAARGRRALRAHLRGGLRAGLEKIERAVAQ